MISSSCNFISDIASSIYFASSCIVSQKLIAGSINKTFLGNRFDLCDRILLPEAAKQEQANAMPASLSQLYGEKSSSTPGGTCTCCVPLRLSTPECVLSLDLLAVFSEPLPVSKFRPPSIRVCASSTVSGQVSEQPPLELLGLDDALEQFPRVGEDATIIPAQIVVALRRRLSTSFCLLPVERSIEAPLKELPRGGSVPLVELPVVEPGTCRPGVVLLLVAVLNPLPAGKVIPMLL